VTIAASASCLVNDLHSQLNATRVAAIVTARDVDELRAAILRAQSAGTSVSISGGRHAMGGQQFGESTVLIDTRGLDRVLAFDAAAGLVTVEGGIQWPALLEQLERLQAESTRQWGIYLKQTGADRLSLAGALACNAHGRGLTLKPIVQQVEAFDLVDGRGQVVTCSRQEHPEIFRLAVGGYGLFGVIVRITLRLRPRVKVRRVVTIGETSQLVDRFEARIRDGFLYGDFQFAIDTEDDNFLRRGVFSCYDPVPADTPLTEDPDGFSPEDWTRLTWLAHRDKGRAFDLYARRYLETSGQIYWADAQLAPAYVDHYHTDLDRTLGATVKGTEMITELFVPRPRLAAFMEDARDALRLRRANVIYGTIRLIERDDETFLVWARERYACVIFNLHVDHTTEAIAAAADAFRELIDLAIRHGGSYYLTYHRWARPDQVEQCYPQMREFLLAKRRYDPAEIFQSGWYRHYRRMFG
jgi:FAD/FMN-containing dehydrogenase